jgi:mono/diheme cytochrome c family protein
MLMQIMKPLLSWILAGLTFISLASNAQNSPYLNEEPTVKRQQQLHQLLLQDCSVCHGKLLKGDLAPPLTPEALADKGEWPLVRIILRGHDKTEMPAWAWELEEYEARWLVRFIRSGRVNGK